MKLNHLLLAPALLALIALSACGGAGGGAGSDPNSSIYYPTGAEAAVTSSLGSLYNATNASATAMPVSGTATYAGSALITKTMEVAAKTADILATGDFGMTADFGKSTVATTISGVKQYNGGTTPTATTGSITGTGTINGSGIVVGTMSGAITPTGGTAQTVNISSVNGNFKQVNGDNNGGVSLSGIIQPDTANGSQTYVYMGGNKK